MNKIPEINISDYTYELPVDKIAQFPLKERDSSGILIYNKGEISRDIFRNIPELLPKDSLLIFNKTKVINARLKFKNSKGKEIEIFTLEPAEETELVTALQCKGNVKWLCLIGNLKAWKNETLEIKSIHNGIPLTLRAELLDNRCDSYFVGLSWQPAELTFAEILELFGNVPLPPYMKRNPEASDRDTYQTVYAENEGSVAAPTAGLHFTPAVFDKLADKNIKAEFITLHVGAGTFKPVKSGTINEHSMHAESFYIDRTVIERILESMNNNKIIAVGTTSMRTIESLYWFGVQLIQGRNRGNEVYIGQWEPYENNTEDVNRALNAVLGYLKEKNLDYLFGKTGIIIVPGYEFKIFNGLITNFHQPQSTLLLLIAAFIGDSWKRVYDYALNNDFRFLSYGDSSVLFR